MKKSIRISTDQYPNKKVDILRTVFVKINDIPVMRQLIAPLEMNRKRMLLTTLRNQKVPKEKKLQLFLPFSEKTGN